ncbi:hypothetical protein ACQE98_00325 [Ornithinimicrobium sp. W1679]|uniref:hypothetical protein n=1 Tax=Ornithinimicrobium sp. W1679 TaxID=3418770 RepID=UPI003CF89358
MNGMPWGPTALSVATLVVLGAVVVVLASRLSKVSGAAPVLLTLFGAHLAWSLSTFALAEFVLPDEVYYHRLAIGVSEDLRLGRAPDVTLIEFKAGWVYVLGALYALLGEMPQVGLVLNATLMSLVPVAVARATHELGWERAVAPALLASCVAPAFLMWGSRLLREGLILLALSILVAAAARFMTRPAAGSALLVGATLGGLYYVRGTAALIVGISLLLVLVVVRASHGGALSLRLQLILAAGAPLAFVGLEYGATFFGWDIDQANLSLSYTNAVAESSIFGGSVAAVSSPVDVLVRTATVLPTALLGPLPWQMTLSPVGLIAAIDAVSWWFLVYYALRGWADPSTVKGRWLCVLPALALVASLTLTTGAFGALIRYRAMALPFIIPLAMVGFTRQRDRARVRSAERRHMPTASTPLVGPAAGYTVENTTAAES